MEGDDGVTTLRVEISFTQTSFQRLPARIIPI